MFGNNIGEFGCNRIVEQRLSCLTIFALLYFPHAVRNCLCKKEPGLPVKRDIYLEQNGALKLQASQTFEYKYVNNDDQGLLIRAE